MSKPLDSISRRVWSLGYRARLLVGCVLAADVALCILLQHTWTWSLGFFAFEVIFGLLTVALPAVCIRMYRSAERLAQPVSEIAEFESGSAREWIAWQMQALGGSWRAPAFALLAVLVGVYSTDTYWITWSGLPGVLFHVWIGAFFFGYGLLAYGFVCLVVLVRRISQLSLRTAVFHWPVEAVREICRICFRVLVLGAALYGSGVISVWLSPDGAEVALKTRVGNLWVFVPAACIIVYYLAFLYPLHRLLRRFKHAAETQLSRLLEDEYGSWTAHRDAATAERISQLLSWREQVRNAEEWPLNFRAIALTITTLLLPTIKVLLDLPDH
jgi:hypothetical protein